MSEPPNPYAASAASGAPVRRGAPEPVARSPRLGWVAMIAGVLTVLGPPVAVAIMRITPSQWWEIGPRGEGVGTRLVIGMVALWLGLAMWATVQGIVAVVQRRGHRPGVVAIVLGVGTPILLPLGVGLFAGYQLLQLP